jgi:oxaloacetate decarboxylase (Na+ extruding) subunit gamma
MQSSLLQQGVELMLFGMGTVFMFLACLVLVTTLMSKLLQRLAPVQETLISTPPAAAQQDDQLLAVISAAVHKYRSRRKP